MTTLFYDVRINAWLKQIAGQGRARKNSGTKPLLLKTGEGVLG
jgi:hypothetical protein